MVSPAGVGRASLDVLVWKVGSPSAILPCLVWGRAVSPKRCPLVLLSVPLVPVDRVRLWTSHPKVGEATEQGATSFSRAPRVAGRMDTGAQPATGSGDPSPEATGVMVGGVLTWLPASPAPAEWGQCWVGGKRQARLRCHTSPGVFTALCHKGHKAAAYSTPSTVSPPGPCPLGAAAFQLKKPRPREVR